jgi:hypothetical protein
MLAVSPFIVKASLNRKRQRGESPCPADRRSFYGRASQLILVLAVVVEYDAPGNKAEENQGECAARAEVSFSFRRGHT